MSVEALLKQIEQLADSERDELFRLLDDRYGEEDAPIEISDEMRKVLEQRDAEYEANPNEGYTWEEVVSYVKRQK